MFPLDEGADDEMLEVGAFAQILTKKTSCVAIDLIALHIKLRNDKVNKKIGMNEK